MPRMLSKVASLLFSLSLSAEAFVLPEPSRATHLKRLNVVSMGLTLHGSQQTRSPLVSWYLLENNIEHEMMPPRPSNHPFGQIPFLTDDGGVEVFESGAILLYLAQTYGPARAPQQLGADLSWVMWANSELDPLCFGKGMSGTQLDQPNRAIDRLEQILGERGTGWLTGPTFGVADVAVGSYLNYVPVFFKNADPSARPNICRYMQRCAERPEFAEAFGAGHADMVKTKTAKWLS